MLELADGHGFEIDIVQDEALLCAVLEGLDDAEGERSRCLRAGEVGEDV